MAHKHPVYVDMRCVCAKAMNVHYYIYINQAGRGRLRNQRLQWPSTVHALLMFDVRVTCTCVVRAAGSTRLSRVLCVVVVSRDVGVSCVHVSVLSSGLNYRYELS